MLDVPVIDDVPPLLQWIKRPRIFAEGFDKGRRCGSPRGCIKLTPVGAGADCMDAGEDRYGRDPRLVGDLEEKVAKVGGQSRIA
jgi:hypothetical protein